MTNNLACIKAVALVILLLAATNLAAQNTSTPPQKKIAKKKSSSRFTQLLLGAGGNFSFLAQDDSINGISSTARVGGFSVVMMMQVNRWNFQFDAGYRTLQAQRVNGYSSPFPLKQNFYPFQLMAFYMIPELNNMIGFGGGLQLFRAGVQRVGKSEAEDTDFTDLYLNLAMLLKNEIAFRTSIFTELVLGLNLTPGRNEYVGINQVISVKAEIYLGALIRL